MSKILDEKIEKMTIEEKKLWALRHTTEHLLHTALQNLYPKLKKAMGPATKEGFYFDFDPSTDSTGSPPAGSGQVYKISEADFPKIEKEMQRLIDADFPLVQEYISGEIAREIFKDNPYKLEWVDLIEQRGEKVSVYKMGTEDLDLCSGPHVSSTGEIKAFKLMSVAGAYWHGDEKNKMLTRIYGTAFPTKEELDHFLWQQLEAEKRDHKKLGRELQLFMFHETAPGMPYWLPKGVILYNELINFWRAEHQKKGYQEIVSPLLNKKELYVTSGHYDHYWDNMFVAKTADDEEYGVKAMNCPNAHVVFASSNRSYRDLPLRLSDTDTLHRFELSGTLNGLFRVREFRQDDAHIYVAENQIESEYREVFSIVRKFYSVFGIEYSFRLGTRNPENFMGDIETWDKAEASLKNILEQSGVKYFILDGDGAFYGPKVDILMRDALGREWQMGTIQLDFQQPRRFNLEYTDSDGSKKPPVVIHRVIYGSLERFIGIIIEHFAGAFPAWLSPVQVKVIPVSDKVIDYARAVYQQLQDVVLRTELDDRNEKLGAKIRDAQMQKTPYMIIVGQKEVEGEKIAVRLRDGRDLGQMVVSEFIVKVKDIILAKSLNLW